MEPQEAAPPSGSRGTFAALNHPNYRRWFVGQLISLFGTWMQVTAQGFLVFQLTGSPAYLGYVGFASGIPAWLLTLYGGVLADRWPRRRLLLATQSALMVQAFALAALTFTGAIRPWHLVLLAAGLGVVNAFDAPARQAFVLEMVDRESLTNAIALNSTVFNSATTLGPAAAGLVYAAVGPASCFVINGLSFIAVIAALLSMKLRPLPRRAEELSATKELQQGLRFVAGHPIVLPILIGLGVTSALGMAMMTLMPAWAVDVLHGHARTNGLLFSARGVGSLGGALMIASLGRFRRGRLLTVGTFALPLLMLVFAFQRWLPLSLLALVAVGWALMVVFNLFNALVQMQLPDDLRGRVMSVYTLVFFGMMPIGALLIGQLAAHLGAPLAVTINASLLLLFAAIMFRWFPALRRLES